MSGKEMVKRSPASAMALLPPTFVSQKRPESRAATVR